MTKPIDDLHARIHELLDAEKKSNPVSYNKDQPYQSYERISFPGLRWSVERRIKEYGLDEFFAPDTRVLDIGSNFGFFVNEFALNCGTAHGVEPNTHLNAIGTATAEHLGIADRVAFFDMPFEEFEADAGYDTILSLAAFFTADGRERAGAQAYFGQVRDLLVPGGRLFYESTSYTKGDGSQMLAGYNAAQEARKAIESFMTIEKEWETVSGSEGWFRYFVIARKGGA